MGDNGETLSYQDRTQLSLNRTETNLRIFILSRQYDTNSLMRGSGSWREC